LNKNELKKIIDQSHNMAHCLVNMGWKEGTTYRRKLKKMIAEFGIDTSHFESYYKNRMKAKYKTIEKICPVCSSKFNTQAGHSREKTTCSHACSNTYFNGITRNVNVSNYRTICFKSHKKECIVCGEYRIVEVHHLDHDNKNNNPDNLIPLCSTHHRYWHSRYRTLVENQVLDYIEEWKLSN